MSRWPTEAPFLERCSAVYGSPPSPVDGTKRCRRTVRSASHSGYGPDSALTYGWARTLREPLLALNMAESVCSVHSLTIATNDLPTRSTTCSAIGLNMRTGAATAGECQSARQPWCSLSEPISNVFSEDLVAMQVTLLAEISRNLQPILFGTGTARSDIWGHAWVAVASHPYLGGCAR